MSNNSIKNNLPSHAPNPADLSSANAATDVPAGDTQPASALQPGFSSRDAYADATDDQATGARDNDPTKLSPAKQQRFLQQLAKSLPTLQAHISTQGLQNLLGQVSALPQSSQRDAVVGQLQQTLQSRGGPAVGGADAAPAAVSGGHGHSHGHAHAAGGAADDSADADALAQELQQEEAAQQDLDAQTQRQQTERDAQARLSLRLNR